MDTSGLTNAPATKLARLIREGEVSSEEVVTACLDRIEATTPELNAVVQVVEREAALGIARQADAAVAAGDQVGPLHGLPMTVKDNLDTAGIVSTGGTAGRSDFVPDHDATAVARVKAAGAIVIGKTNTPELTLAFETDNTVYGATNNPYDTSRTSGGSSGGAAANLAVGGTTLEIGSDTAGSVRVPSHFCGTAGLRTTSGRVARTGHILPPFGALEELTVLGPMARTVEDLELLLPVLCGPDPMDPAIVDMPLDMSSDVDLSELRIAKYVDNGIIPTSAETVAAIDAAAEALEKAGAEVEETRPPGIEASFEMYLALFGADGGAAVRNLLEMYGTSEPSPLVLGVAGLLADFAVDTPGEFDELIVQWGMFKASMLEFMSQYDLLLTPVTPTPAVSHGTMFDEDVLPGFSYALVYNLTGWPCSVVRAAHSEDGLPIGAQLVSGPWREDLVLAGARVIEDTLGGFQPPNM